MSNTTTIALRPCEGRRLILPYDASTMDGLPLQAGTDLPAEGALVARSVWTARCISDGDAELVPPPRTRSSSGSGSSSSSGTTTTSSGS